MIELSAADISTSAMLVYLGADPDQLSPLWLKQIEQVKDLVLCASEPRFCFKRFTLPLEPYAQDLLVGEDIRAHLAGCESILLFACTLGQSFDRSLRRLMTLDTSRALLFDTAGSVLIEAYADRAERELRQHFREQDLWLSTRFAPGYGDFPLSRQRKLLTLLDSYRSIGLALNTAHLMHPIKSISALMGLYTQQQLPSQVADPCSLCHLEGKCALRTRGGYCGKFQTTQSHTIS